ncbi:MAG: EamA family transporter [Thermoplasmata archaeon]
MARPGPANWILAVLYVGMVIAWGLNFLFVKVGLASSPPLWLAAFRALLGTAGVALGVLVWPSDIRLTSRERRDALLLGIPTTGLFFALWFSAATQVPPGQTAVVIYTFPLWVVLLSFLLLGERAPPLAWVSVVVGFLGVVLIEQPWSGSSGKIPTIAIVELLAAAACWALGTVLLKSRIRGAGLRTANAYQLLSGAVLLVVAAAVFEPHPTLLFDSNLLLSLLWLGLIGTSMANVVWFMLLERFPAPTVSTWAFLTPVVALVASVVIFGERLNGLQLVGVAAVLAGAFVISGAAAPERPPLGSSTQGK